MARRNGTMREPEKGTAMWRYVRRPLVSLLAVAVCAGGQVALAATGSPTAPAARAGDNLLGNPGAQAGAASRQGWDSVTIPGWQVAAGLPTVVRYGTAGFPRATGRYPARPGGQLFSGGVGGTAVLAQQLALRAPDGRALSPGTRYELSGWLGGTRSARASVSVRFLSAAGQVLGDRTIGPVGLTGSAGRPGLVHRSAAGTVPRGTASARVTLRLGTSLPGADGTRGAMVGYNRAIADGLRFSVGAPARRPALVRPPVSHVPHYQHVFLFYFENQDFSSLIGDTRRAPYLNSLLPSASLLANTYAEEHPSDGNYLAMAGGSTFGAPLTDPLEANPLYTIHARSIADLLDAAGESWKGYLQSADGPCDDTVHGSYWNDDLPLLYFAHIRNRPGYCARHVVPLETLPADLSSAATTPRFAWIGPNDCSDMEGCGIHAGDVFLARELGRIVRSPAWRTQRSLAIITVDEDNYDHPDPPQRVATLMLASSGVRHGYVSRVRYTHYSLLRTIEAALGLPSLTANDRYAQPVNDVFGRTTGPAGTAAATRRGMGPRAGRVAAARQGSPAGPDPAARQGSPAGPDPAARQGSPAGPDPAARQGSPTAAGARPARAPRAISGRTAGSADRTAFVVSAGSGTVTPVDLRTRRAGRAIRVGAHPTAIVAAPDGRLLYVADSGAGLVTPINAATRRAGRPIRVGASPRALAITPDGRTLYVANSDSGTVTPVSTKTGRPGPPIAVGRYPRAIAISPDGTTAYVLDWGSAQVTPISIRNNHAEPPISVGSYPFAAAFAPDGSRMYVASYGSDTVTPITVATGRAGRPVRVGAAPDALAVTPDGKKVFVVSGDAQSVTPIETATWHAGRPIRVGYSPASIALSRSGQTAYVVNTISGTVTPVATATGRRARPISVGLYSYSTVIRIDPAGPLAVVLGTYSGRVSLIDTRTGHAFRQVVVGPGPVAVAFAGGGRRAG